MLSKLIASSSEAISDVDGGAVIAVSGFGISHGVPSSLIVATRDKSVRDLTVVCNSLGSTGSIRAQMLVANRQVSRLICAFTWRPGLHDPSAEQIEQGLIDVELVPQGILVERLRCAGAGLPGFYSPTGVGTPIAVGKDVRYFDGRPFVFESALPVDFAFIRAWRADPLGNVQFRGSNIHFNVSMAKAARTTIVEVDEIVPVGDIPADRVGLPGIFVTRIVRNTVPVDGSNGAVALRRSPASARQYNGKPGWTREQMAKEAAALIPDGSYVNLGTGLPTLVAECLSDRDVALHGENGILGYGQIVRGRDADPDVFDAGGNQVRCVPGTAYFDSVTSFEIARGGWLDYAVLGGYQVDAAGNLASYSLGDLRMGGIGGAMDLVAGARTLMVLLEHYDSAGHCKLVSRTELPLTGADCVDVVVTDLCVLIRRDGHFEIDKVASAFTAQEVIDLTEMPLRIPVIGGAGRPVASSPTVGGAS
jgi:3-oxoacid CoA-transferase